MKNDTYTKYIGKEGYIVHDSIITSYILLIVYRIQFYTLSMKNWRLFVVEHV